MPKQSQSSSESPPGQTILPYYRNLVDEACDLVLRNLAQQLPDLTKVSIVLANNGAIGYCRSVLLAKAAALGYPALLGPHIVTMDTLLQQYTDIEPAVISNHARELLLVDALHQHPGIYQHGSPWVLAESLMELFDELTLAAAQLPQDLDDFIEQITKAYGITRELKATLSKEALLVHTLWYATHQQLQEINHVDHHAALLLRLGKSLESIPKEQQLYFCGVNRATRAEQQWRSQLSQRAQLHLLLHDPSSHSSDENASDYLRCLDLIYDFERQDFQSRTTQCRQQFPVSPVEPVIRVYSADNAEDEALAVDIQTRRWLIQGKKQIGIVTENRKLARRIRALLDRAGIQLEDNAGWPLSTTSAATVLERWLETIEQNFHYLPLLDCLKSPFVLANDEAFLQDVYRLEQHIVIDERTPSDIYRYLKHIEFRKHKLKSENESFDRLTSLITTVKHAAEPLLALCHENAHPATQFIDALLESLARLKVIDSFQQDEAGQQLLSEFSQLRQAAELIATELDWLAFRSWLGTTLERFNFKIRTHGSPVKLITLANSEYYQFDGLIIAGAEQNFLPHSGKPSPFFNDNVRTMLNIPAESEKQALNYYYFRRLLSATKQDGSQSGSILITRRSRENDEEIIASPWITALQAFHQYTYGYDLTDPTLGQLVNHVASKIRLDTLPLPATIVANPGASTPANLVPASVSASSYQQLIDCPYQFFAAQCLGLTPPEEVKEALKKSDYGERVHRCLEAFHSPVDGLPGPFREPITEQNRTAAEQMLTDISQAVFSSDIEDNFMHRGWLQRWRSMIPLYVTWQIQQQSRFKPVATELRIRDAQLSRDVIIKGRIDRIDHNQQEVAVIDYKTGAIPSPDDVANGEAIQLPFYLLLLMTCTDKAVATITNWMENEVQALYVDLDNAKKISSKVTIEHQQLTMLVEQNRQRLLEVMQQIKQGKEMPAWGDKDSCKYCVMDGLCRKQAWSE